MKIGDLAQAAGMRTSKIRYYERAGLIPEPVRRANGYRDYPDEVLSRLQVIELSQQLGFSLAEIKAALPSDLNEHLKCADIVTLIGKKVEAVDEAMAALRTQREQLVETAAHYAKIGVVK